MRTSLVCIFLFICLSLSCQIDFEQNLDRTPSYSHLLNKYKQLENCEFQLRVWISRRLNLRDKKNEMYCEKNVFVLTLKGGRWQSNLFVIKDYDHIDKNSIKKQKIETSNPEDIWSFLEEHRILEINKPELYEKVGDNGDKIRFGSMDAPLCYDFELISNNKYRFIRYVDPLFFLNEFPERQDLQDVCSIIEFLKKELLLN